jgi:exosortase/archaeosortase family protein
MKKRKSKKQTAGARLKKSVNSIWIRYLFIILVAIPNLWLFYAIFTPLTIYPVLWLTGIFFDAILVGNVVLINNSIPIELIRACIAGSAYYLLFILNMSVPNVKLKKRINMILFSFLSLLVLNILRIFLLTTVFVNGYAFFDVAHQLFWYGISTLFVVGIWFANIKIFKVKTIPFYSDVRFLYGKFIRRK